MKIYTKTGDGGTTGLFGGGRVPKNHHRVEAYGELDELNAHLGWARTTALGPLDAFVAQLQSELFTLGSHLATPPEATARTHLPGLPSTWIEALEKQIDACDAVLPPLKNFLIPGGSAQAAALHLARTVCRRAERRLMALPDLGEADRFVLVYLNRLSDCLFTLARMANHQQGVADVEWLPSKTPSASSA